MIFKPYLDSARILKGYAKKTYASTYIPTDGDVLVKMMEDDCSSVFMERNALRNVIAEETSCQKGNASDYLRVIGAGLEEGTVIDWYAGFLNIEQRAVYHDLVKDKVVKEILVQVNEMHFGHIIQNVREILMERAFINGELIVYEKKQQRYLDRLEVLGLRSIKGKTTYDKVLKLCLPNKHVIITFEMDSR